MKPRGQFEITEFENGSGSRSWRVIGTKLDGERVRRNFASQDEAAAARQVLERERMNATATPLRQTRLTPEQIADAESAFHQLAAAGKLMSLSVPVNFFLRDYREPLQSVKLSAALESFLAAKQAENCRPDTIRNLRGRVGMFARSSDKEVGAVSTADIESFIHRDGTSPENKNNDRRALNNFFRWSAKKKFTLDNPVARVSTINMDEGEPVIMPVESARRLLDAAESFRGGIMVPYVALGLFCAIRPKELARLSWDEVDLAEQTVNVHAKIAKMRARRLVQIPANAVAWLRRHARDKTPIKGKNWRKNFEAVKTLAGLNPWTQDIMRHTGISHHLGKYQHEGQTAAWAGNSPDMIQKHYKGLVREKDTKRFWSLKPSILPCGALPMPRALHPRRRIQDGQASRREYSAHAAGCAPTGSMA